MVTPSLSGHRDAVGLTRPAIAAVAWLLLLACANVTVHGSLRALPLFAAPVCWVAWRSLRLSFAMAALAVASAWIGGAFPPSSETQPLTETALFAYLKLSLLALVASRWAGLIRQRSR